MIEMTCLSFPTPLSSTFAIFMTYEESEMRTVTTSRPPERRSCASVVLIEDNKALLFGGVGSSSCFNDVHLYDIAKSEWSLCRTSGSTPCPRGGCVMVSLGNQFVFMFGGRNDAGEVCSDSYLFDCDGMHWTHLSPMGVLPPPREDAVIAFARGDGTHTDDRVYIFGGCGEDGALGDLWCLFIKRMQWTQVANTTTHFPFGLAAPAVARSDDEVFVFGGYDRQGSFHDELYCFHLATESWRPIEVRRDIPSKRTHAAMILVDGVLVLYGGYGTEGALGDVTLLKSGGSPLSASSCLVVVGMSRDDVHCGLGVHRQRGAACSFMSQRHWFIFGGCDGLAFLDDLISVSLNDVLSVDVSRRSEGLASPASLRRPEPTVNSSVAAIAPFLPSAMSLAHMSPPYHHERNPPSFQPLLPSSPPLELEVSQPGAFSQQDEGLSSAIAALKKTLFGNRVERVDTLVEENRKLREENARLQEIVLDLRAKLENRGHPYGGMLNT